MSSIEDAQRTVEQLSADDLARFREWFEELEARLFDEQIARDLKAGKLDKLLAATRANYDAGLGEALSERDEWVARVCYRLADIAALPRGWDGYDAERVSAPTLSFAAMLLANVWTEARALSFPAIGPMSSGAIIIEWRTDAHELTVEVKCPNDVDVLLEVLATRETEEFHLTSDFARISEALELCAKSEYVAVA